MGKKDHEERKEGATEAVIQYLKKQAPLTVKQEKFCSNACVERFLKVRDYNVKKAAKSLRSCLSWRESIGTDHLIADEFSAELAEGVAYVAGHDEESRPVLIFRIKQDYQKFHSQKLFTRLLVFTFEVAIGTMAKSVQQLVLLFDASLFRSASAFINLLLAALKILGEYYPGRLHRAFVIDAPTLFSYLWKGVRSFVELSSVTTVLSSLEFEDSFDTDDFASSHGAASLRFHPSSVQHATKPGSSSSSRFSFTVSHHLDSLKPWYLSLTNTSSSKVGPTSPSPSLLGPARISPLNARSISFASPAARMPRGSINEHHAYSRPTRKTLFPSTPLPQKTGGHFWTPRPSFLQSPAAFFKRDCSVPRAEKSRELFASYLKFYRRPYDEMAYRSKMRPPLGRLVSVVHPQFKRRHVSMSQRF